jgi:hypothetical protein
MNCRYCGSARLEDLGMVMHHPHQKCQACNHLHIGGILYHDRYCCDRIYQQGGGAKGSTAASRALYAAAVAELQAKLRDGRALRLSELHRDDQLLESTPESMTESPSPSESSTKTGLLGFVRKLVR